MTTRPHGWCSKVLLAVALCGVLCAVPALVPAKSEAREVRVGVYAQPPLIVLPGQGAQTETEQAMVQGLAIDVLREVARENGWRLSFVRGSWPETFSRLQTGRIDLIPVIFESEARRQWFDFSNQTLLINWGVVYARPESGITTFPSLDGKRVALVEQGFFPARFYDELANYEIAVEVVDVGDLTEALEAVSTGRADAAVVNRTFGAASEARHELVRTPVTFSPVASRMAVRKGADADLLASIDASLATMKENSDSVYHRAVAEWMHGAKEKRLHETYRQLAWGTGGAALMLALAALFWFSRERASSRRLHTERQMRRRIFDHIPDMVMVIDVSGTIIDVNATACYRFGYTRQELLGMDIARLDPDPGRTSPQRLEELTRSPRTFSAMAQNRYGVTFPVEVNTAPFVLDGTSAFLCLTRDISEHIRHQQEVAEKNEELQRLVDELTDFAYVASHDLQEPLRKITAFGERLMSRESAALSERGRDYIERMRASATRMSTLLEDLQRYSRVTSQAKPMEPVDLGHVLADVREDLSRATDESGAVIEVQGEALPTVAADPTQMRQLLQNLLANAIKFARPDTVPHIILRAESDAEHVTLHVADNGIGFEQQYAERIFRPFQRLVERSAYAGTGMGLAICHKIVTRHGGTIRATSVPGEGTTFHITLPRSQPDPSFPQQSETPHA